MTTQAIHYELYLRRRPGDEWALDHAGTDQNTVLAAAGEALAERRASAVRVCREMFREGEGFITKVLFEKDLARAPVAAAKSRAPAAPACSTPGDLLSVHARSRLAELFEPLLTRERLTAWELLHRPDIAERLEASGLEVQGAVQRAAVPEAQAQGTPTHDMIRAFQRLADATLERLIRDGRRRIFPTVAPETFTAICERLCDEPDAAWRLGGGVAAYLQAPSWREKADRLTALLAMSPPEGRGRALAHRVLEPPLAEMLGGAAPLADLVGAELDLGGQLAVMVRIAIAREVELLGSVDAEIGRVVPPLTGPAARLSESINDPAFAGARAALAARIAGELRGPRRLRPADPDGELAILRALAAVLTAAIGRLLPREAVEAAFLERSKRLVAADFVGDYLEGRGSAAAEARALLRLCLTRLADGTDLSFPLFDRACYAARLADAGKPGPAPGEPSLLHWLRHGRRDALVPIWPFNASFYLRQHPDVLASGMVPYEHFCLWAYGSVAIPTPCSRRAGSPKPTSCRTGRRPSPTTWSRSRATRGCPRRMRRRCSAPTPTPACPPRRWAAWRGTSRPPCAPSTWRPTTSCSCSSAASSTSARRSNGGRRTLSASWSSSAKRFGVVARRRRCSTVRPTTPRCGKGKRPAEPNTTLSTGLVSEGACA